jgi:long-subunit fatty acid transport protein
MIKKFILSICLFFSLVSFAQEGTSSPYSYYGIGDVKFKGTAENRAMGGLTIFPDSIHVNFQNPASYTNLRLTAFSIGGTYLTTKLKTSSQEEKARRTAMDYLAVGIPMGKFGAGFGLMPYSSVGYKIKTVGTNSESDEITEVYSGTGGLNKAFVGFGYAISSKFSLGVDLSYNFGKIETNSLRTVEDYENGFVQNDSRENNTSNLNGATFTAGLGYQAKINKKLSVFSSLTFSPESKLKVENNRKTETISYTGFGSNMEIDVENKTIKLPAKFSFGVGIGEFKKWMIGTEVTFQQSSSMSNRFNDIYNAKYNVHFENAVKYNIGGYFIPNYNSFSSYWNKVTYRGGLRYENTGLAFDDKSINDLGMTIGLGLPIPGAFSNVNVGFEFGKKGTTSAGLVQENYANISIGLSFNDKWFTKRLYN